MFEDDEFWYKFEPIAVFFGLPLLMMIACAIIIVYSSHAEHAAAIEDARANTVAAAERRLEYAATDRILVKLDRNAKRVCISEHLLFAYAEPTTYPAMESNEGTAVCATHNHVVKYFDFAL